MKALAISPVHHGVLHAIEKQIEFVWPSSIEIQWNLLNSAV